VELLHGAEEPMGSAFVDGKIDRKLSQAHFGAVLSQMQKNAHGFLQGLAGAGAGAVQRTRVCFA
jgi:hypothetical protein